MQWLQSNWYALFQIVVLTLVTLLLRLLLLCSALYSLVHSTPPALAAPAVTAPLAAPALAPQPKLVGTKVKASTSTEEWNVFTRCWAAYKSGSNITTRVAAQLLECTSEDLGDTVQRAHPDFTSQPIEDALV